MNKYLTKRQEDMDQAHKWVKWMDSMSTINAKEVTTRRQYDNGTHVFRLPFKDAWGYDIEFATYKSGYVRRICKVGACPCYQINKRRKIDGGFHEITTGPHAGLFRKRYNHSECILIEGNGDRLEYLFKYIMRNFFRAKPKYNFNITMERLDWSAKWVHGEFGFETCDTDTQDYILKSLQH